MFKHLSRLSIAVFTLLLPLGAFAANTTSLRDSGLKLQAVQQQFQVQGLVQQGIRAGTPGTQYAVAVSNALNLSSRQKLELVESAVDSNTGLLEIKYQQVFQGVPLWANRIMVTQQQNGEVKWLHGTAVTNIAQDVQDVNPNFGTYEALNVAKNHNASFQGFKASSLTYDDHSVELRIWLDDSQSAHLVYVVKYFAYQADRDALPLHPVYIIDAHTGVVLDHWNGLQTARQIGTGPGGNAKVGRYTYGGNRPKLFVTQSGSRCTLQGNNVITANAGGRQNSRGTVISFNCPNNPGLSTNGGYGFDNDAHFYGHEIIQMYQQWYNTQALPFTLRMVVNIGAIDNAFWGSGYMRFGNGRTQFYPLVGMNVAGHEVSHGFTQYASGLVYQNQSGGINESFSDMAGETLEQFIQGSVDWQVGADIDKRGNGLRSMSNPPADGRSIDNARDYRPGMNVHFSSGVFNKAFYLLSTHSGWNIRQAFAVFVEANQRYWSPNATFRSAGQGAVDAADALGYNSCDVSDIMAQVGVATTPGSCTDNPTPPDDDDPTPPDDNDPVPPGDGSCQGVPVWDASAIYTKGDQVRLNGKLYTANWWNQGASPERFHGQWQVWTLNGDCSGNDNPTPPDDDDPTPPDDDDPTPPDDPNPPTGCQPWAVGTTYQVGDIVSYEGQTYTALIGHTAYSSSWNPVDTPALWSPGGSCQ